MAHYRKKNREKVVTGSFYLSEEILELISVMMDYEAQSRNAIIGRAIAYQRYMKQGDKDAFKKSKREYKKKKKVSSQKGKFNLSQTTEEEKSLFDKCYQES